MTLHLLQTKTTTNVPVSIPAFNGEEEFVGVRRASKLLGVQPPTVVQYIRSGAIPASKVGRKFLIRKSALLGYIDANAYTPQAAA